MDITDYFQLQILLVRKDRIMKKRIVALLLCAAVIGSMAGCGKESDTNGTEITSEASHVKSGDIDIDYAKQVSKLAEYKGIEVTLPTSYEVTDEACNNFLTSLLTNMSLDAYKEVKDKKTVGKNDIVKADYTGYVDDKKFDGGEATDQYIDVAGNSAADGGTGFIEGFTDALKGAKVGETVKGNVKFPDNYGSEDLAGKDAVFEFKIHSVVEPVTFDDIDDAYVEKNFKEQLNITTVKDLKAAVQSQLESNAYSQTATQAKTYMLENSTVEVPDDYLQARLDEYVESFEKEKTTDTQTVDEYYESIGQTRDSAIASMKESLESQIKLEFIFGYIADKEKVEMDEDDYSQFEQYVLSSNSSTFTDANAMYEYYGNGDAKQGEDYLKSQYLCNKAIDYVVKNAKVTFDDGEAAED